MKCTNCGGPFVDRKEQMLKSSKMLKQMVMQKTCYNCGKPQAPRQSMRSMKPRQK